MDFFETVRLRRSIRKYTSTPVPGEVVANALEAAIMAPNSSNMQTWQFIWVQSVPLKDQLIQFCLNQSAARTAQELIVIVADYKKWSVANQDMIEFTKDIKAPKMVLNYYRRLIPFTYSYRWLRPLKWLMTAIIGTFRPIMRGPIWERDLKEVSIKSAALAAENFMLAITAQGFATCPMEGIDEKRIKAVLKLAKSSRVVMVVSIGEADPDRGTWGPQRRLKLSEVMTKV